MRTIRDRSDGKRNLFSGPVGCRLGLLATGLLVVLQVAFGQAAAGPPYAATPQRPTFTTDTSITAPGTLELEFGGTHARGFFSLPAVWKFTPDTNLAVFRQTEFSVGFDALTRITTDGRSLTQFGDRIGFAFRRPLYQGENLSMALAPLGLIYLRGSKGGRLGLLMIGTLHGGQHAVVLNVAWSSATSPSKDNPRHLVDFMGDYTYSLAESGFWSRWTVYAGYLLEKASGVESLFSLEQGLTFRLRPELVLDVGIVEQAVIGGKYETLLLVGFTYNFGRVQP